MSTRIFNHSKTNERSSDRVESDRHFTLWKRSENEEEVAHNKIEHVNNKMLQSIEENDKTIMWSLEEKKKIIFAYPRQSNMIVKLAKETPKVVEATQDENMTQEQWLSVNIDAKEALNTLIYQMRKKIRRK